LAFLALVAFVAAGALVSFSNTTSSSTWSGWSEAGHKSGPKQGPDDRAYRRRLTSTGRGLYDPPLFSIYILVYTPHCDRLLSSLNYR
jgi:hypothetical protein